MKQFFWVCDRCKKRWEGSPEPKSVSCTLEMGFGSTEKFSVEHLCSTCQSIVYNLLWQVEYGGEKDGEKEEF